VNRTFNATPTERLQQQQLDFMTVKKLDGAQTFAVIEIHHTAERNVNVMP